MGAGALPTKTSVRVSFGTEHADLPLAYEGAAGVMGPDHVKGLNQLLAWQQAIVTGGDAVKGSFGDIITRAELNEALAMVPQSQGGADPKLAGRVAAVETILKQQAAQPRHPVASPDIAQLVADQVDQALTTKALSERANPDHHADLVTIRSQLNDLAEAVMHFAANATAEPAHNPTLKPLLAAITDLNERVQDIEQVLVTLKQLAEYKAAAA